MAMSPAIKCVLQYGGSHGTAKNLLVCQNSCHTLSFQLVKPNAWLLKQVTIISNRILSFSLVGYCFILDFFLIFSPCKFGMKICCSLCVCVAFQSCAELQPFQVELLFGSKTYPKNRKCGYKWQQLAGRTCSDAILELLLIFSTQFQVKHPFKLIRAITVSLEYQWRNWSRECNLSTSWILRRC